MAAMTISESKAAAHTLVRIACLEGFVEGMLASGNTAGTAIGYLHDLRRDLDAYEALLIHALAGGTEADDSGDEKPST